MITVPRLPLSRDFSSEWEMAQRPIGSWASRFAWAWGWSAASVVTSGSTSALTFVPAPLKARCQVRRAGGSHSTLSCGLGSRKNNCTTAALSCEKSLPALVRWGGDGRVIVA